MLAGAEQVRSEDYEPHVWIRWRRHLDSVYFRETDRPRQGRGAARTLSTEGKKPPTGEMPRWRETEHRVRMAAPGTRSMQEQSGPASPAASRDAESSFELLCRAQAGDQASVNLLIQRYLPALRRWAHGRLPGRARGIAETEDLVQESVIHAFSRLASFEHRGSGALLAYLRQVVLNRVREEVRRADRRPLTEGLDSQAIDPSPSPLDAAIGGEAAARYESALAQLRPEEREAVVGRLEMGCTYEELAAMLGKPSPDAARMAVTRALVRLTQEMGRDR